MGPQLAIDLLHQDLGKPHDVSQPSRARVRDEQGRHWRNTANHHPHRFPKTSQRRIDGNQVATPLITNNDWHLHWKRRRIQKKTISTVISPAIDHIVTLSSHIVNRNPVPMSVLLENPSMLKGGEHGNRPESISISVWNQHAPRVYVSVVLCFPFEDGGSAEKTKKHLKSCLAGLASDRPLLSSQVGTDGQSGYIGLVPSSKHEIPFTSHDFSQLGEYDYDRMREEGFPPHLFMRAWINTQEFTSQRLLPVSYVRAIFCKRGLMLAIYTHHSVCDGDSLRQFVEYFAAKTRGAAVIGPFHPDLDDGGLRPRRDLCNSPTPFKTLIERTPEYTILRDRSGPTQPNFLPNAKPFSQIEKTGRIFVFSNEKITRIQDMVRCEYDLPADKPTKYSCLAALTFAHVIKARLEKEDFLRDGAGVGGEATLWNSVNWKLRAFQDITREYLGNATLPVITKVSTQILMNACEEDKELVKLVLVVKESIDGVDETYICKRLAMLSASTDPRSVGVDYDPRMPNVLAFNTWRHFGAEPQWNIPGVPATHPDAIRRGQEAFGMGTALILPANASATSQELFVSLPRVSMEALCKDDKWNEWVERTIG